MKLKYWEPPKNIKQLKERIVSFFEEYTEITNESVPLISPRYFRIHLGVSKYTLSNWKRLEYKNEKTTLMYRNMFNLIKQTEDLLLARIEQETLITDKKNIIGMINTLRAYDRERYDDNFIRAIREAESKNNNQTQKAIQIITPKEQLSEKGKQSARRIQTMTKPSGEAEQDTKEAK